MVELVYKGFEAFYVRIAQNNDMGNAFRAFFLVVIAQILRSIAQYR
jgi:hypothetical protein